MDRLEHIKQNEKRIHEIGVGKIEFSNALDIFRDDRETIAYLICKLERIKTILNEDDY
jgi:hypothetical protein